MKSKNVDLVTTFLNRMKRLLPYYLLFFISIVKAQNKAVTDWINKNAVVIEDANPDSSYEIKKAKIIKAVLNTLEKPYKKTYAESCN